jgi:hypothetical protein
MNDLTTLLTGENAALVGCIIAIISTARGVMKEAFKRKIVQRFLPVAPIVLGVGATLMGFGSVEGSDGGWQDCVVLGVVAGFTAGQLFKAGKTSVFGWGVKDQPELPPSN